jgi:hypothetical protein
MVEREEKQRTSKLLKEKETYESAVIFIVAATFAPLRQRGRPGVTPPVKAITEFRASFFVPMGYDYLDWRDPLPALASDDWFPSPFVATGKKELFGEEDLGMGLP